MQISPSGIDRVSQILDLRACILLAPIESECVGSLARASSPWQAARPERSINAMKITNEHDSEQCNLVQVRELLERLLDRAFGELRRVNDLAAQALGLQATGANSHSSDIHLSSPQSKSPRRRQRRKPCRRASALDHPRPPALSCRESATPHAPAKHGDRI